MRPVIAITAGEPAGIGPDLCLTLANSPLPARLVVLADRTVLAARAQQLGLDVTLHDYHPEQLAPAGGLEVLHLPVASPVLPGQLNPANSPQVIALLDRALAGCQSGEFAAMVTAPLHKGVINDAGIRLNGQTFPGHTEYLADRTGTAQVVMMLTGHYPLARHSQQTRPLRVALATTHLPLKDVPAAITDDSLSTTLRILDHDLRTKFGLAAPRILVAGLNPHAGEDGHLGREELDVIIPTLNRLRGEGLHLIGPLPADTLFNASQLQQGDAVLAMYHDQGLPVLKHASFGQGVNVTLGLPIIRTSVDHGTALAIAGKGQADPGSLQEALQLALELVAARARHN